MPLPTTKTTPQVSLARSKTLIYGYQKVGKTTLAAGLMPDKTLIIGSEPGHDHIAGFVQPVATWPEYLAVLEEVRKGDHPFKMVVIDTVDELLRMCADYVIEGMAITANLDTSKFIHVSDFGWGKGQDAVLNEWRLRIGGVCHAMQSRGGGVVLVSHVKEEIVKERNGLERTKLSPKVGMRSCRDWLLGYVDMIFYAETRQTTDGEERVLHLQPSDLIQAGGRLPEGVELEALVELTPAALKQAFRNAAKPPEKPKEEKAAEEPVVLA